MVNQYKHWTIQVDEANIVWLGFDRQDERVNSINEDVLDELNGALHDIAKLSHTAGLVIYSAKSKGFIAGADIHLISKLESPEKAVDFLRKGQAVFSYLEHLSIPTVAMINGFCMGGGMELALACDYRIASDEEDTVLGLPEILLGFHPGWGGTVRLPKLIGGFHALTQMMLTGAPVKAKRAKALGVVDDVVPFRQLKRAAVYYIQNKPKTHMPTMLQSLTNVDYIRPVFAKLMRYQVAKKIRKAHYPAPFALIDLWEKENQQDDRAYLKEADSVHHLLSEGDTAHNLIRVFLLRERLKGFAKESDFKVHHVHVIGAGVMGGDIAAWCALKGIRTTLQDQSYEQIAPAISRAYQLYKKRLKTPRRVQKAMDLLIADPAGNGAENADVIIEAVFENLEVKQAIMKHVESVAKPHAVIATNTSSIPLDEISQVMSNPDRLVGIHFFNPVPKMELVEVVKSVKTSAEVLEKSAAFVSQIGRLPLPVKSSPGFLVNRVLMPYLLECVQLLDDGYQPELIDESAKAFGMMMGPVELADTVGMDVCLAVAQNLSQHFGGHIPKRLAEMVQAKKLGRKTGEGFYRYKDGKPIKQQVTSMEHSEEISHRLILRMINEANLCLREGVVEDADLLDAGMVFGTGFAPFRGGPMNYAKHFGEDKLNALISKLHMQYGARFKAEATV